MTASPETIHERGRAALLAGEERFDVPPGPASPRWGVSAILRPDPEAAGRLADLAAEAAELAGPHQWQTGSRGAAHLTLCTFEEFREDVTADDPAVRRFADAVATATAATAETGPLAFRLGGVALADRGVLVMARPLDERPMTLRAAVLAAMGETGRGDDDYRREVWWSTVLHFAGPVARRTALVDWADARADLELGELTGRVVELVRYEHRIDLVGPRTVPVTLATFPLTENA